MTTAYSFCESTTAGSLTPWHIRPLTAVGKKLSGGVDTDSLCGHVTRKFSGWDLEASPEGYPLDKVTDGRRHVCKKCADKYLALMAKLPVVTFTEATDKCCEILNGFRADRKPRWPAEYKAGGISVKHEREHFSVTVDADPYFSNGKLGWKVRVSCNANQLSHDSAQEFSTLYMEAVRVAREAQTFMGSVEIDLKTLTS